MDLDTLYVQTSELWSQTIKDLKFQKFTNCDIGRRWLQKASNKDKWRKYFMNIETALSMEC